MTHVRNSMSTLTDALSERIAMTVRVYPFGRLASGAGHFAELRAMLKEGMGGRSFQVFRGVCLA